jgi:hypothetical protein
MFAARLFHVLVVVAFATFLVLGIYQLLEPVVKALAI